jgi:hypothetical protein
LISLLRITRAQRARSAAKNRAVASGAIVHGSKPALRMRWAISGFRRPVAVSDATAGKA